MATDDLVVIDQPLDLAGQVAEVPRVGVDRVLGIERRHLAVFVVVLTELAEDLGGQLGEALPAVRPLPLRVEAGRPLDLSRDDHRSQQVALLRGVHYGLDELLVRHVRPGEGAATVTTGQLRDDLARGARPGHRRVG
ncbi:hypothetical protein [Phytohabitans suffuscus]